MKPSIPSLVEALVSVPHVQPDSKCDPGLFDRGVQVLRFAGPRSWLIDRWVREVRERAGVPVDWHFSGGRAILLALPEDADLVSDVVDDLLPSLEAGKRAAEPESCCARWPDEFPAVQVEERRGRRPPKPSEFPPGAVAWDPALGVFMFEAGS